MVVSGKGRDAKINFISAQTASVYKFLLCAKLDAEKCIYDLLGVDQKLPPKNQNISATYYAAFSISWSELPENIQQ